MEYLHIKDGSADIRTHLRSRKVALWNTLLPTITPADAASERGDVWRWIFAGACVIFVLVVVTLVLVIIHGSKKGKKYSQLLRGSSGTSYSVNL